MAVRETLELDLRSALSGLTAIDRSLAGASARFSTALAQALSQLDTKVDIDADAGGVSAAIDEAIASADSVVEVEADTAAAAEEIEGLEASAPDITVEVDADVGPAEDEIQGLGAAAERSAKQTSGLGGAVTGLQAAAGLAVGQTAALADGVAGVSKGAAAGATVVTALAASTKLLFDNALEAIGAEQRLEQALGNLASRVDRINVGSLNEDLGTLAIKLGSSDDAIRDAISSIFQFGTSSGVAGDKVEETAEQLVALAARAVALRPSLGDVGEVADTMGIRLARGGRFAAQFGIALNAADIEARAREMFNLSGEVGIYEKVAAAADLATQKYGASLKRDIEQGSKNPIIQVRALKTEISEFLEDVGRPLVLPVIEAFRESVPAVQAFATAIGSLVEAGLPVVVEALKIVTPILEVFASIIEVLPDEVLQVAAALVIMSTAAGGSLVALAAIKGIADLTAAGLRAVFGGANDLTDELDQLASEARAVANLSDRDLNPALDKLAVTAAKVTRSANPLVNRLFAFESIAEANIGTAIRLADQIDRTGGEYAAMQRIIDQVAKSQQQQAKDSEIGAARVAEEGDAFDKAASQADTFKTALDKLLGIHADVIQAEIDYRDAVTETTDALRTESGSIDISTVAGRKNISAIIDAENAAREYSDALIREQGDIRGAAAVMESFTKTIRDQLIAAGNAPETVDALLKRLGLLGTDFNNTGAALGKSLVDGVAAGIAINQINALGAAGNFADAIAFEMNRALGIDSPSKVAQKMGEQVVAGFALGLSDTGSVSAASRLAFAATSGVSAGLRSATGGGTGGQVSQTSVHNNPTTIVVQAPMPNPAAVGLETARVLRREQFLKGR